MTHLERLEPNIDRIYVCLQILMYVYHYGMRYTYAYVSYGMRYTFGSSKYEDAGGE